MKKVLLVLFSIFFALSFCSCKKNGENISSDIDAKSDQKNIQIGSVIFSQYDVEETEEKNDNSFIFTLDDGSTLISIVYFDVSDYDATAQEAYAEMMQETWLEGYPKRSDESALNSVMFNGKSVDVLTYEATSDSGLSQYHVAGSFCYNGYSYTIGLMSILPHDVSTDHFISFMERADRLTTGNVPNRFVSSKEEQYTDYAVGPFSSPIIDISLATEREKEAWGIAQDYLSFFPFSRGKLISQLMFDGFTEQEANYAINHLIIDWNAQALSMAQDYLNFRPFSFDNLLYQLECEQFTEEQALYGVQNCGADWNVQASKCAKEYREFGLSGQDLYDQLLFEGFTNTEAQYGVNNS